MIVMLMLMTREDNARKAVYRLRHCVALTFFRPVTKRCSPFSCHLLHYGKNEIMLSLNMMNSASRVDY